MESDRARTHTLTFCLSGLNTFQYTPIVKNIMIGSSIVQCTGWTYQEEEEEAAKREEVNGREESFWIFQIVSTLLWSHHCPLGSSYQNEGSWRSLCKLWLQNQPLTLRASHRSRLFCGYSALSGCFRSSFALYETCIFAQKQPPELSQIPPPIVSLEANCWLTDLVHCLGLSLTTFPPPSPHPQVSFGLLFCRCPGRLTLIFISFFSQANSRMEMSSPSSCLQPQVGWMSVTHCCADL